MNISVAAATAGHAAACRDFLAQQAAFPGHVDANWAALLQTHYGITTTRLLAQDADGNLRGLLFCYYSARGHTLYSPPYGLIAADTAAGTALLNAAQTLAQTLGLGRTIITSGTTELAGLHHEWSRHSITLPLPNLPDDEALLAWLPQKTRNMVRKARRAGLVVFNDAQHLPAFYQLYRGRLAEKGLALKSQAFFADMMAAFGEDFLLLTAHIDGTPVGAMVFHISEGSAAYLYNAANDQGMQLGCNNLLMAEAIRQLCERGVRRLDLGESAPGSGVYDFKTKGCGGTAEPVHYHDMQRKAGTRAGSLSVGFGERAIGQAMRYGKLLPASIREALLLKASSYGRVL